MQVDIAERRKIEHPLRNDAPITDYDDGVGFEIGKLSAKVIIVLDAFGLRNRQSEFQCGLFDRGRDDFEAASLWPIRLRHHESDVKSSLDQLIERRHREARRTAKSKVKRVNQSSTIPRL